MRQYRHGDLLIVEVDDIPPAAVPRAGRVLAEGEATGHAHVLEHGILYERDDQLYFRAPSHTAVGHEEHRRIPLPPGCYRVQRQREYTPAAPRYVID